MPILKFQVLLLTRVVSGTIHFSEKKGSGLSFLLLVLLVCKELKGINEVSICWLSFLILSPFFPNFILNFLAMWFSRNLPHPTSVES